MVVGFLSQSVVVSEDQGPARLEIGVISGALQRDLALQLTLTDISAQGQYAITIIFGSESRT